MLRTVLRLTMLSLIALSALLATPKPGEAIFHLAVIDEVMSGFGGDPNVQYVEVLMEASGQNIVNDTRLTAFNADGSSFTVLLLLPDDVPNGGTDDRWIMATQAFADLAGMTPDFIFPAGILTPSGMVCWGAPASAPPSEIWDPQSAFNYTDCVAYGDYTGGNAPHPPPTDVAPGDGTKALQRIQFSTPGGDLADFALRCPTPENNAGQVILLGSDDDNDGLTNCQEADLGTNPNVVDTDSDGCADGEEVGSNAALGGERDPTDFWDFFDTPDGANVRDTMITVSDIGRVVGRFGTFGSDTTVGDALSAPPASGYHAAFDRSVAAGSLSGPADGSISIGDIGLLVGQFGHSCSSPP